jgi:hypothetical protein
MSSDVTMQELELETAELLPARETLCRSSCGGGVSSQNSAGFVNVLNGDNISVLSGNNVLSGIGVLGSGTAIGGGTGIGNL